MRPHRRFLCSRHEFAEHRQGQLGDAHTLVAVRETPTAGQPFAHQTVVLGAAGLGVPLSQVDATAAQA